MPSGTGNSSPKNTRRNVHFKSTSQENTAIQQNILSVKSGSNNSPIMSNKSPHANRQNSRCPCGASTLMKCARCNNNAKNMNMKKQPQQKQQHEQHMNPNARGQGRQAPAPNNAYAAAGYNFAPSTKMTPHLVPVQQNSPANQPQLGVFAYMTTGGGGANGSVSVVPNARVAFQMFHSLRSNPDMYSNYMMEEDLRAHGEQWDPEEEGEDDEDEEEEDDYDRLISCSEWGDISEIS